MTEQIQTQLEMLARFRDQKAALEQEKQGMIDAVLTLEIRELIADIEAEFVDRETASAENIVELTSSIKANVLDHGEKVKGSMLQAVWVKGRSKWDTKGLQGYAKAHPEVAGFYQEGDPSVSIRKV